MAAPTRRIAGIKSSIPAGYVLGRVAGGEGDVGLISITSLGQTLVSSGVVSSPSASSSVVAGTAISVSLSGSAYTVSGAYTSGTGITITGASIANSGVLSLTAPAAGFGVSSSTGAITFTLNHDLSALEALAGTGIAARTAADTWAQRTITGTSGRLSVSNGDGVSGNPTLDIDATYVGQSTITTLGTIGTGTWQGAVITGQFGGTGVANTGKTITLGGNLATSGAFATTLTVSAATNSTLPSGTHTLAGLDVVQTWSAAQSYNSGDLKLNGSSSGAITINAAAAAGTNTITLPAGTTDFSATGGTSQVVKQTSSGGALTVGQLATSDLSDFITFTADTPTVTATVGTFTTVSGTQRFMKIGKLAHIIGSVTITTNGTAAGQVKVTLPAGLTLTGSIVGCGRANTVSGKELVVFLADATHLAITNYDFTYPGSSGEVLVFSIFSETT